MLSIPFSTIATANSYWAMYRHHFGFRVYHASTVVVVHVLVMAHGAKSVVYPTDASSMSQTYQKRLLSFPIGESGSVRFRHPPTKIH